MEPLIMYISLPMIGFIPLLLHFFTKSRTPYITPWSVKAIESMPSSQALSTIFETWLAPSRRL